jgi:hypothetical protein
MYDTLVLWLFHCLFIGMLVTRYAFLKLDLVIPGSRSSPAGDLYLRRPQPASSVLLHAAATSTHVPRPARPWHPARVLEFLAVIDASNQQLDFLLIQYLRCQMFSPQFVLLTYSICCIIQYMNYPESHQLKFVLLIWTALTLQELCW